MFKSFKVRIYPDDFQIDLFKKTFGCCRKVYNHFLSEKEEFYKSDGKYLSYNDCSSRLTVLKDDLTYLREVDSTALVQSLRNLENAFKRFFDGISDFPRFKSNI